METKPSSSEIKKDILVFQMRKVFKKNAKSMAVLLKLLLRSKKEQ